MQIVFNTPEVPHYYWWSPFHSNGSNKVYLHWYCPRVEVCKYMNTSHHHPNIMMKVSRAWRAHGPATLRRRAAEQSHRQGSCQSFTATAAAVTRRGQGCVLFFLPLYSRLVLLTLWWSLRWLRLPFMHHQLHLFFILPLCHWIYLPLRFFLFATLGRFKRGSAAASQAQYLSASELKARLKEMKVSHQDCLDKVGWNHASKFSYVPFFCYLREVNYLLLYLCPEEWLSSSLGKSTMRACSLSLPSISETSVYFRQHCRVQKIRAIFSPLLFPESSSFIILHRNPWWSAMQKRQSNTQPTYTPPSSIRLLACIEGK